MPRSVWALTGNVRKRPIRETQAQYCHETALSEFAFIYGSVTES